MVVMFRGARQEVMVESWRDGRRRHKRVGGALPRVPRGLMNVKQVSLVKSNNFH
jgi:hypothetical protein